MFSAIKRAFNSVTVTQRKNDILVDGIPADVMVRDIAKIWATSKINLHMFNSLGKNSFSFNTFFAPEIVYILDILLQSRKAHTSARVLNNIRNEIIQNTYLKNTLFSDDFPERLDFSKLANMVHPPFPFQMEYLKHYSKRVGQYDLRGYLLAAAAGSGKTLTSLSLAECLGADLIIIISPNNALHRVWDATLKTAYKKPHTHWIFADGKPYKGERAVVFHYEALKHAVAMLKAGKLKGQKVAIILDESHNMNEVVSLQTQLFIEVCELSGSQDITWMSGTAIKALGSELIPLMRTICKNFTADSEEKFKKIFGKAASKALDIVNHRLGLLSYTIKKDALQLQPPIMRSVGVKIPNPTPFTLPAIRMEMERFITERWAYYGKRRKDDEAKWKQYITHHKTSLRSKSDWARFEEYQRNLATVIQIQDPRFCGEEIKATNAYEKAYLAPSLPQPWRKEFADIKSVIKYTALKIQGECLGRVLGRTRIDCCAAMVPHVDFVGITESTLKKTVVFTSFVDALTEMDVTCRAAGLKPLLVYGKTNNELAANVEKFEKNPALNPLGATYQSLSTAVPLTMADTMILLNSPFRGYILEQAISRIHRIGQDSQTVVYQCYLDTGDIPNISTRSNEILAWSQEQVSKIMGIESPFKLEEASMEAFAEAGNFDDNQVMRQVLQGAFDGFDIHISTEDFEPAKPVTAQAAWTNW